MTAVRRIAARIAQLPPALLAVFGAMIVLDGLAVVAYRMMRTAYLAAPDNESFQPGDDPGYFADSVLAGGISLLRDAAIAAAVVLIAVQRGRIRRLGLRPGAPAIAILAVLASVSVPAEVARTYWSWRDAVPTARTLHLTVVACAINLAAVAALAAAFARPSRNVRTVA